MDGGGVPDLSGLTRADAEEQLESSGFTIGSITEVSSDAPLGEVVGQSPAPGAVEPEGTPVDLVISMGLPAPVPHLIGLQRAAAETAIAEAQFTLGRVTERSSTATAGEVIDQTPAPGAAAAPRTPVNLVVSSGIQQVNVPNVVGRQAAEAGAMIASTGLTLGAITMEEDSAPAGQVLSQSPSAGAAVMPGAMVDISISAGEGRQSAVVPNVTGGTRAASESAVTEAGLVLGGVTDVFSDAPPGEVVAQSPPAGAIVPLESPVSIQVSAGVEPISVPDVVGLRSPDAGASIAGAGLSLGAITEIESTAPPGEVLSQIPPSGEIVPRGSAVDITVSESAGAAVVPELAGSTETSAVDVLQGVGLALGAVTNVFSDRPVGEVIGQHPLAGTLILLGSAVDIEISGGLAFVAVPAVTGMHSATAGAAIAGAGLRVGTVARVESNNPAGEVLSQSPAAGAIVSANSAVDLTVSEGAATVEVPDITGGSEAEASLALETAGLVLGAAEDVFSAQPVGRVIGQSPSPGSVALRGTAVMILVSAGAELITVPDLLGLPQAQAGALIATARLSLGTVTEVLSPEPGGQVVAQDPAAGSSVAPDTPVALEVSSFEAIVSVPDLSSITLEIAQFRLALAGLRLGEVLAQPQVTVPAVMVIDQDPGAGMMIAEGSDVSLTISVPPDPGAFLTLVNTPVHEDDITAEAYYAAIDPFGEKTTLSDWYAANGFGEPGGMEASAYYFNEADLGFGRQVHMRSNGSPTVFGTPADRIAFATLNHPTVDDTWQNPDEPIATVCMDMLPAPEGGEPYIRFYVYGSDGNRLNKIDLDGRGDKYVPGMCTVCHGGQPRALVNGVYPDFGNINTRFIPFDLESFLYSETNPEFNRASQEGAFYAMNKAVLDSYAAIPQKHIFTYNGPSIPIPDSPGGPVSADLVVSGLSGGIVDVKLVIGGTGLCSTDVGDGNNGIDHTWVGDLLINLVSPSGIVCNIMARRGSSGNNICGAVFDDAAAASVATLSFSDAPFTGIWMPEEALSKFVGSEPNGAWRLFVEDEAGADTGNLNHWSLQITTDAPDKRAAEELIEGWYGGPALPFPFDGGFVPEGWSPPAAPPEAAELYSAVVARSCRLCHVQQSERLPSLDFDTFAEFELAKDRIRQLVFQDGTMPAALPTYDQFWLSSFPYAAGLLANFVGHGTSGPGRPVANAGTNRTAAIGETVVLNGIMSNFADSYTWSFVSVPSGSASALTGADTAMPSFQPDLAGAYTIQLIVTSGSISSASDEVTVTAVTVSSGPSFSMDVLPILTDPARCVSCHQSGGVAAPSGFFLDSADSNVLYNEVVTEFSTAEPSNTRVNTASPAMSLILRKASNSDGNHGGGMQPGFNLGGDRSNYDVILEWIDASGAANN
ncbi:MAG: PASTA domain-containing protein [Candidatus Hydrogenedentes bacterium]|nr:PASTA domain-containing protein [Candidatus Hydrogenedentota bacterium]